MCILISEEAKSQALNQQADQTHNESGKHGLPQREKQSHSEELPPFNWEGAGIKGVCSRIMCKFANSSALPTCLKKQSSELHI